MCFIATEKKYFSEPSDWYKQHNTKYRTYKETQQW